MIGVTVAFSAATKLLFYDLVLFCFVGERGEVLYLVLEKRRWLLWFINGMWCFVDLINLIITGGVMVALSVAIVFFFFLTRLTWINPFDPWPDHHTGLTTKSGLKSMDPTQRFQWRQVLQLPTITQEGGYMHSWNYYFWNRFNLCIYFFWWYSLCVGTGPTFYCW